MPFGKMEYDANIDWFLTFKETYQELEYLYSNHYKIYADDFKDRYQFLDAITCNDNCINFNWHHKGDIDLITYAPHLAMIMNVAGINCLYFLETNNCYFNHIMYPINAPKNSNDVLSVLQNVIEKVPLGNLQSRLEQFCLYLERLLIEGRFINHNNGYKILILQDEIKCKTFC